MIEFNSSLNPTIGVEIELQLIDDSTKDLKNISPRVLTNMDENFLSISLRTLGAILFRLKVLSSIN